MVLAVSVGEPAGIGPDLIAQLFARRLDLDLPPFCVFGNADLLLSRARRIGLDLDCEESTPAAAAKIFPRALPVVPVAGPALDRPGRPSPETAALTLGAIEAAVAAVRSGACAGLVTAPIAKSVLYDAGFRHPGHTEYLAALCAADRHQPRPVMMLADEGFRVVPATIHVALAEVPRLLTKELIIETGRILCADLKSRFGLSSPRIAVTGLNPHAGEAGAMGREEIEVIAPAIATLQDEGMTVTGPLPADTLFHRARWEQFDAVLAMYHDQALIPIKTLAFDRAVNVTLGLPIVRTSPDHGTAFDLAGTGSASSTSFAQALRLAWQMSRSGR